MTQTGTSEHPRILASAPVVAGGDPEGAQFDTYFDEAARGFLGMLENARRRAGGMSPNPTASFRLAGRRRRWIRKSGQSRLNMNHGLFEVVLCSSVRLDIANMTLIEGDTGVIGSTRSKAREAWRYFPARGAGGAIFTEHHTDQAGCDACSTTGARAENPDHRAQPSAEHAVSEHIIAGRRCCGAHQSGCPAKGCAVSTYCSRWRKGRRCCARPIIATGDKRRDRRQRQMAPRPCGDAFFIPRYKLLNRRRTARMYSQSAVVRRRRRATRWPGRNIWARPEMGGKADAMCGRISHGVDTSASTPRSASSAIPSSPMTRPSA
jgi:hypothetical protein